VASCAKSLSYLIASPKQGQQRLGAGLQRSTVRRRQGGAVVGFLFASIDISARVRVICAKTQVKLYFLHIFRKMAASPDHDQLYQFAETQAGYFTTAQARAAGFSHALLSYHVQAGLFERLRPGVYRLKRFPASPHEDLFVAWLRAGAHAVISHDSALALYDLSDLLPNEIHLTVPRTASRRHPGLRLHTTRLELADATQYAGLPVTTVARTIADVAASGLSEELIGQAIEEAVRRGLTTVDQLHAAASRRGRHAASVIEQALTAGKG